MKYIILFFRRIWQLWYFIAFYGVYLCIFPIYFILLLNPNRFSLKLTHVVSRFWSWSLIILGLTYCKVTRNYTLEPDATYLYASNHRSFLDIPLGQITIPYLTKYLGKIEIAKLPLFGYMLKRVHILVKREKKEDRAKSLQMISDELKKGYSVFIYPEGTSRTPYDNKLGDLKNGVFILALQTRTPLIPITILNSNKVLSNDGKFWVTPFIMLHTILDPPIPMDDLTEDDVLILKQRFRDVIDKRLSEFYGN